MTKVKFDILRWNEGTQLKKTSCADSGVALDYTAADNKLVILFENTSSKADAKIMAGTGIQGVADITVSLEGNKTTALSVESGAFKQTNGENKGCVIVKAPSTVNVTLVKLP